MSLPEPRPDWIRRAMAKNAIVPKYFEVFPTKVLIECGQCGEKFQRNLVPRLDEPTFICPDEACRARNWVPITFNL